MLIPLAFIAFISLGLPDGLLGVAWPYVRESYDLPLDAAGLLVLSSTIGLTVSSFFNGWVSGKLGIGRLLAACSFVTALALVGYTIAPNWHSLVVASVAMGAAAGTIDPTVNGFVATNYGPRLMQWLHASFGVGVTLGPIIMTLSLTLTSQWIVGYWLLAMLQAALGILFWVTADRWNGSTPARSSQRSALPTASLLQALGAGRVQAGLLLFFIYTGMEVSVGLWTFSWLTETRQFSPTQAGIMVSTYWAAFTVGRITAGFATSFVSADRILLGSSLIALSGTLLLFPANNTTTGIGAVVLIGLGYAPVYPSLMTVTRGRVGSDLFQHAMGLQVSAASLGVAVLPGLLGILSARYSLVMIPWFLLVLVVMFLFTYLNARRVPTLA